ncbi:MAG: four-carbon acid sugar kinase family protein [Mesorhizobium sp.]
MTQEIRVLADDLSGALDTAVCFVGLSDSLLVTRERPAVAAFACSTGARDLSGTAAAKVFALCLPWLLAARWPFHKIDSRLRGHAAREITAIRRAAPDRAIVIAPALPAHGRIVRSGRVLSRAGPDEAWMSEPTVLTSELASLGLDVKACLPDDGSVPQGISLWDAETDQDLEKIAITATSRPNVILCGSSGLASAFARVLRIPSPRTYTSFRRPKLLIAGTAHPRTLRQIGHLHANAAEMHIEVATDGEGFKNVAAAIARGDNRLITPLLPAGSTEPEIPARIKAWLVCATHRLPRPGSLFVTGGETLDTLTGALSSDGLIVTGQFAEGVPASRFLAGRWGGLDVVSKSGGFGPIELLSKFALDVF